MISKVRGHFNKWGGTLEYDENDPTSAKLSVSIDAASVDTRDEKRDAHLRSADFFDVERYPAITFSGRFTERTGDINFNAVADLSIRGITRPVRLDVSYLGQWATPFWVGDENRGTLRRIGFEATARVNRHDWDVSWQDRIPGGGVVVSNEIELVLDLEAILDADLESTGAIEYYREPAA
jgi:polyisoprenoid-binding protein YceI